MTGTVWQQDRDALADQAEQNRRARAKYDDGVHALLSKLCASAPGNEVQFPALQHGMKMRRQECGRPQIRASLHRLKVVGRIEVRQETQGHARCFYKPTALRDR